MAHDDPPAVRPAIVREAALCSTLGVSPSWLDREIEEGRFPKPIKLSPNASGRAKGWLTAEIDAWLAARVAERDAAA